MAVIILRIFTFQSLDSPIEESVLEVISLVAAGFSLREAMFRRIFRSPSKTLALILAVFCFGAFMFTLFPQNLPSIADVPSSAVRVEGLVSAEVERRVDGQRIELERVRYADETKEGKLLVWAPLYPLVEYGDSLVFNCRVERPVPFEGFAYDRYLATKGIYAVCFQPQYIDVHPTTSWSVVRVILAIKTFATDTLREGLPEPHASFLSGLLFGGSTALSGDLKDDFRETGTSHILAASGYNVSIFSITFLSFIMSTRLGRRRGLILTTILLVVYVIIAGASAAVVRAGIMGFLVVLEKWISRKAYMLNVLLLTASLMLLFNPFVLYDVGFQLSFIATIAIVTLTKPWSERLDFVPDVIGLRQAFAGSLAATVLTLPIVLWHFGTVSLVSPFANLLVLPLVPYAMATTGIGLVGGILFGPIGQYVSLPAWALSNVMLRLVEVFGSIPFALAQVTHARLLAVAVAVILFLFWFKHRYASSRT
ncbi:ComEC/Rec2 family competence protein [Candidatus Uhrbacteria bacterium]|nr:ComEC/Rec2 family competence protein [Candidatus Uhrbacteria bacterium]